MKAKKDQQPDKQIRKRKGVTLRHNPPVRRRREDVMSQGDHIHNG